MVEKNTNKKSPKKERKKIEYSKGVVTGGKLNVREKPSRDAVILGVLDNESIVKVDVNGSTKDYWKVVTEDGPCGYCAKKFIKAAPKK